MIIIIVSVPILQAGISVCQQVKDWLEVRLSEKVFKKWLFFLARFFERLERIRNNLASNQFQEARHSIPESMKIQRPNFWQVGPVIYFIPISSQLNSHLQDLAIPAGPAPAAAPRSPFPQKDLD